RGWRARGWLRGGLAAVVVVGLLSACSAVPTSGSVQLGAAAPNDAEPDVDFIAEGPEPDAAQQQILLGFIDAATSTRENYAVAREYLTPEFAAAWHPDENVTVDVAAERRLTQAGENRVELSLVPVADVDAEGVYRELDSRDPITQEYRFEQVEGQWRIAEAPAGLIVEDSAFTDVFSAHALSFFDPSWSMLVPELRWFPSRSSTATRVVSALLAGPSEWLSRSVVSAFPADARLSTETVPTSGEVADVSLAVDAAQLDDRDYSRMLLQLQASLEEVTTIASISMTVNGVDIEVAPAVAKSTRVDSRAAVVSEGTLGFLAAGDLSPIDGVPSSIGAEDATSVVISADRTLVAVGTDSGTVAFRSGVRSVADARTKLVAPTVDDRGFVWSVPEKNPDQLRVVGPDGPVPVRSSWPEGATVSAAELSRDASRLLVLVDNNNSTTSLMVAGVQRNAAGVPTALSDFVELSTQEGQGIDATWVDSRTVAELISGPAGETLTQLQEVGGRSSTIVSFAGASSIVGGNGVNQLRAIADDGRLAVRRQAGWQFTASQISVLATQMGTPD
ncbi:MAG: GerMN domain-containing protein, partial [Mycetocola sp.]